MNHSFLICLVSSQAHVWYLAILIQPANSHSISVITGSGLRKEETAPSTGPIVQQSPPAVFTTVKSLTA